MSKCPTCRHPRGGEDLECKSCGRALPEREPGDIVGNYKIVRLLGQGAMGCVYEGEHMKLGRRDAVKMMSRRFINDAQAVERFFAEARAVNKLRHEGVVQIFDVIEAPGQDNYYVMDLLEGDSLSAVLEREGRMPLRRALVLGGQLARVLVAVHEAGLVHGDVKPENIIILDARSEERIKLFDFGLVAKQGENRDSIEGSPAYLAPEAYKGAKRTRALDVYAFGVVMYELLTGRKPFVADDLFGWMTAHETAIPPSPAELAGVPEALSAGVLACLAKSPAARPEDLAETEALIEQTSAFCDLQGGGQPVESIRSKRRPQWLIPAVAAAGIALVVTVAWGVSRPAPPPPAPLVVAEDPPAVEPAPVQVQAEAKPAPAPVEPEKKKSKAQSSNKKKKRKGVSDPGVIDAFK